MPSAPSFLYRNHCGTLCYQRRIPEHFRINNPSLPPFFRRSLKTTNKKLALPLSRRLSVMFDELAQRYFVTPEDFYKALQLLQRQKIATARSDSWEEYEENYLIGELGNSDKDTTLLQQASTWSTEQKKVAPNTFTQNDVFLYDDLAKQYFSTPEELYRGLQLHHRDIVAQRQYPTWDQYEEHFLNGELDEDGLDFDLITRITQWMKSKKATPLSSGITQKSVENQINYLFDKRDSNKLLSVTLAAAIDKFINESKQNWKTDSKSEETYKNEIFPLFTFITEAISTDKIDNNHIQKYKQLILKLPKNKNKVKIYRNLSLKQIYEMEIPESDQLSKTSKTNYLQRLASFLEWLAKNNYTQSGLSTPLKGIIKKTMQAHEERNIFTDDDLRKLFNSKEYTLGLHTEANKYWVPLLSLLTGARTNELCQLHLEDVYELPEEKIWVIDINENNPETTKKSLKRPYHRRHFPISKILIKLGFIEYTNWLREKNETRLFPELPFTGGNNKFGSKFSKWFNNTYMNSNNCNITTEKTSVYSLRHNFITYLTMKLKATEVEIARYLGQTAKGGVTTTRYTKPIGITEASVLFGKVNYHGVIDFSKIRKFNRQILTTNIK